MLERHERIFVALDTADLPRARALVRQLRGRVGGYKIGLELFCSHGPDFVREVQAEGARIFVDLKLHDIPNTARGAAAALTRLGVDLLTVHAGGGGAMIRAAVEAANEAAASLAIERPTVLAVTLLTSHDDDSLPELGLRGDCSEAVTRLAALARDAGAGGIVCSPDEVAAVRALFPRGTLVVPGIRTADAAGRSDDQRRTATPAAALAAGADLLVIGRPITQAENPAAATEHIVQSLG